MAASTSASGARFRLYALSGLLCLWLLAICVRLVYLQIFCYGDFERRAQHQQQRSFDLSPKRGVIYDRAGRELAMLSKWAAAGLRNDLVMQPVSFLADLCQHRIQVRKV